MVSPSYKGGRRLGGVESGEWQTDIKISVRKRTLFHLAYFYILSNCI